MTWYAASTSTAEPIKRHSNGTRTGTNHSSWSWPLCVNPSGRPQDSTGYAIPRHDNAATTRAPPTDDFVGGWRSVRCVVDASS